MPVTQQIAFAIEQTLDQCRRSYSDVREFDGYPPSWVEAIRLLSLGFWVDRFSKRFTARLLLCVGAARGRFDARE